MAASAGEDATQWAGPEGNWGGTSLYCTSTLFTYITSTQMEYIWPATFAFLQLLCRAKQKKYIYILHDA